MHLLPFPRELKRDAGVFCLPKSRRIAAASDSLAEVRDPCARLAGFQFRLATDKPGATLRLVQRKFDESPEAYELAIGADMEIGFSTTAGLHAAIATLRQLLREYGRRLPRLRIRDWPDFPRRGVMLDISRGRVPRLATLFDLADKLADFKINELQLYTEHTFAYAAYRDVWKKTSALTAPEIARLNGHCRRLGIDLVPNQNSFGHLREFLAFPPLRHLAEVSEPYEATGGGFLRYPSTLAPRNPGTLPFLRSLYDELLPNFSSDRFNVGCDETWDLGLGQSRSSCEKVGKGRVYLDFLKSVHREVTRRGLAMMFWGDIILKYPKLIRELPRNAIALNWGYEADHPFQREAAQFRRAKIPFYVCPGTSTWMTLIGRHDNAFANLRAAAAAGMRHGAGGYLITDWGDGGHPQPLAVSFVPYLAGASLAWCGKKHDQRLMVPVLSRDVFHDPTHLAATAATALGLAHRKLGYVEPNATPLGATLAAPLPDQRELFCRNGLKYYARIPGSRIAAALNEIEVQRKLLNRARPSTSSGKVLGVELDLAARMAAESCRYMQWQQARARDDRRAASALAKRGVKALGQLETEFLTCWRKRNKGLPPPFLEWRRDDYQRGILHFRPEVARC
ncbi:MAG TPA: glycoside hydrolase family 20 zincin-like fold domain-containing protein [Verrucomicrobiae bacterium]|nr:glycoside hydrolase family 20 zincin-like fold domain-containing protein [Verrucomicrobiae bacterium]